MSHGFRYSGSIWLGLDIGMHISTDGRVVKASD